VILTVGVTFQDGPKPSRALIYCGQVFLEAAQVGIFFPECGDRTVFGFLVCVCDGRTHFLPSFQISGLRAEGEDVNELDCFSSGWVELFGLSCCRRPYARRVCVCALLCACHVWRKKKELEKMMMP